MDDEVRAESRRHGIVLVPPLARALALAAGGAALVVVAGWPASVPGALALALAALSALRAVWRWDRTLVRLTRDRLVVVHGTLRRRTAATPLHGAVEVEQTLLGRLLGYATVVAGELEVRYVPAGVARLLR